MEASQPRRSPLEQSVTPEIVLQAGIAALALNQAPIRMPFVPKAPNLRSQLAPGQVIDPCPPQARMPRGRFGDRSSREF